MPTTPNGAPYPASTDTPDVPRDIGALAAWIDTAWTDLVLASGYAPIDTGRKPQWRRTRDRIEFRGVIVKSPTGAWPTGAVTVVTALPAAARPLTTKYGLVQGSTGATTPAGIALSVSPAGAVVVTNPTGAVTSSAALDGVSYDLGIAT